MNPRVPSLCVAFLVLTAGAGTGCSVGKPPGIGPLERSAGDLPDSPPDDFAVAATVFADLERSGEDEVPRFLRSGRYVLQPDGVLRVSVGAGVSTSRLPPPLRRLIPAQVEQLWTIVRRRGYLDGDLTTRIGNPELAGPETGRTVAVVWVSGAGEQRAYRFELEPAGLAANEAAALIDELARLAWLPE